MVLILKMGGGNHLFNKYLPTGNRIIGIDRGCGKVPMQQHSITERDKQTKTTYEWVSYRYLSRFRETNSNC